ncbi:MAG TPA: phosphoribosylanthranilate isomerase [Abditibacterium sp.]|jgi:phosphoribosylanthranilate isomerase
MSVQVKICGTTTPHDARLSQESGADFLGVMLRYPRSPRYVSDEMAREIRAATHVPFIALSVNQNLESLLEIAANLEPRALQLHGDETPELVADLTKRGLRVWKAISGDEISLFEQARAFRDAGAEAILVDAREISPEGIIYGGTGQLADWNAARRLVEAGFQVILAGGLSPQNVARAVESVQPWAVDVVSGVEAEKGIKDAQKVRDFVQQTHSLRRPELLM